MERYPSLVFVIGPDLCELNHPQLAAQAPESQKYRLIRCETMAGVTHVLKHLQPSLVILPKDTPAKTGTDISAFVGEVVFLHSDEDTNARIASLLA